MNPNRTRAKLQAAHLQLMRTTNPEQRRALLERKRTLAASLARKEFEAEARVVRRSIMGAY